MMRIGLFLLAVSVAIGMVGCNDEATPIKFGNNFYEFVLVSDPPEGVSNTWMGARDAAATKVYNGLQGHLATVTSRAATEHKVAHPTNAVGGGRT